MRLFEFSGDSASDAGDDLETVLRNLIGRANTFHEPVTIDYERLSSLLNPMGYGEVNYKLVKAIHDQDPERFKDLISDFDNEGITLATDAQEEKPEQQMTPNKQAGKSVDQMAHNVVSKDL